MVPTTLKTVGPGLSSCSIQVTLHEFSQYSHLMQVISVSLKKKIPKKGIGLPRKIQEKSKKKGGGFGPHPFCSKKWQMGLDPDTSSYARHSSRLGFEKFVTLSLYYGHDFSPGIGVNLPAMVSAKAPNLHDFFESPLNLQMISESLISQGGMSPDKITSFLGDRMAHGRW